jgi:hypothetical protein
MLRLFRCCAFDTKAKTDANETVDWSPILAFPRQQSAVTYLDCAEVTRDKRRDPLGIFRPNFACLSGVGLFVKDLSRVYLCICDVSGV